MVEKDGSPLHDSPVARKLQALKVPDEQVGDVDEDYLGTLLFQHLDFEGIFHADPMQLLPPEP